MLDDKELSTKLKLFNIHPGLNISKDIIDKILRIVKLKEEPKGLKKISLSNREGICI